MPSADLLASFPLLLSPWRELVVAIFGLCFGSFANVVILRLPAGESFVQPGSRCPSCQHPIAWYDNLPLLSYLLLAGRCRHCPASISLRYPLVELLGGLLFGLLAWRALGAGQPLPLGDLGRLGLLAVQLGGALLAGWLLLTLAFIDLDRLKLPDALTRPGMLVLLLLRAAHGRDAFVDSAIGLCVGYLFFRLLSDGFYYLTGREGLGRGDAKLVALIGAWLGWPALSMVLLFGSVQGAIVGIGVLARRRSQRRAQEPTPAPPPAGAEEPPGEDGPAPEPLRFTQLPYGPFLCLGALQVYLFVPWALEPFPLLSILFKS